MASNAELLSRLLIIENIISSAVIINKGSVEVNDTKITDKTGWQVYGEIAGINGGLLFVGISLVATPTTDAHIKTPFIFKAF